MYADDVIVNIENPKQRTGNSERVSKVTEYTTNTNKLNCISVHQQKKWLEIIFKIQFMITWGTLRKKSDNVTIKNM